MSAGRSFIALAALVFAKWRPWPALATCLLFGFLDALAIRLQGVELPVIGPVPVQAIEALPYVLAPSFCSRASSARQFRHGPRGFLMSKSARAALGRLFAAAKTARANAYAPYSRSRSALRCARRLARSSWAGTRERRLSAKVLRGSERDRGDGGRGRAAHQEVLVVGDGEALCTPCGGCRQRIGESPIRRRGSISPAPKGCAANFTLAELLPKSSGGSIWRCRERGEVAARSRPISSHRIAPSVRSPHETEQDRRHRTGRHRLGVAANLARKGWSVAGADTNPAATERFANEFGKATGSSREAASGADVVILVVVNAAQCEAILFGDAGVLASTAPDALIISCVTMDPAQARSIGATVEADGPRVHRCADQRRPGRAAEGAIRSHVRAGRRDEAGRADLRSDRLQGLSSGRRTRRGLRLQDDQPAARGRPYRRRCEAIAFAEKLGLDLAKVYEVITASAGNSWMFENRVPHILDNDYRRRAPSPSSPRISASCPTWPAPRPFRRRSRLPHCRCFS